MGVQALEHVTVRCSQLGRTRDFYVDLLGLTEGPRPAFPFGGYWLYLGGTAVVHLVDASDTAGAWGREQAPPVAEDAAEIGTGAFDHMAFRGDDFEAMRARVKEAGLTFKERIVPGGALKQLFVLDPEGVLVEINFRS